MADFQEHLADLQERGARVVALSADDEAEARETVAQLGLQFDVAYGVDVEATSNLIGCYTGSRHGRPHLQPAAFVLRADGTIAHALYSSGKVGRLTAADALILATDLQKAQ